MALDEARARVELLVRAGAPGIALVTAEDDRAHELLAAAAHRTGRPLLVWSLTRGWSRAGEPALLERGEAPPTDLEAALDLLLTRGGEEPLLVLLHDLPELLSGPGPIRKLLDALTCGRPWTIAFAAAAPELPERLATEVTRVEVPLPDADELQSLLLRRLREPAQARLAGGNSSDRVRRASAHLRVGRDEVELVANRSEEIVAKPGTLRVVPVGGTPQLSLRLRLDAERLAHLLPRRASMRARTSSQGAPWASPDRTRWTRRSISARHASDRERSGSSSSRLARTSATSSARSGAGSRSTSSNSALALLVIRRA